MFGFLGTILNKVISLVAGVIIAVGIVSVPPVPEPVAMNNPQINQTQEIVSGETKETTEKDSEVEILKKEVEELKKLQEKTSPSNNQNVPAPVKKIEIPKQQEIKTFTTPSGAVIDETGNIISGPTKSIPSVIDTNIKAGIKILSGEEIYSLISQSIVLIKNSEGHGTGFVVENGKYIITNKHVVGSDSEVTLTFQDGTSISGPVLGKNDTSDIALIYNNLNSRKAVKFGFSDSSNLKTGADVYALGFPLDYINTVTLTKGLVSANRQQISSGSYIQTDATIHPGNSGGPLVNNKGEVVGINRLVVGAQGKVDIIGGTGISFAIPIETAESLIPSLSQYGQSRYELYPIGSTINIMRSMIITIGYNNALSCELLSFKDDKLTLCNLYKKYQKDYNWNVTEDATR